MSVFIPRRKRIRASLWLTSLLLIALYRCSGASNFLLAEAATDITDDNSDNNNSYGSNLLEDFVNKLRSHLSPPKKQATAGDDGNSQHNNQHQQPRSPKAMTDRRRLLYELALGKHFQNILQGHIDSNKNNDSNNNASSSSAAMMMTTWAVSEAYRVYKRHDHASRREPLDRSASLHSSWPIFPETLRRANLLSLKEAFGFAYDSYMYNAWPQGELKPVSCQPGTFSLIRLDGLTLMDSLDTLLVMGNHTEFARSVERLRQQAEQVSANSNSNTGTDDTKRPSLFAVDQNVSLFETNIRVVGGLLSAHQMALAYSNHTVLLSDVWRNDQIRDGRSDLFTNSETTTRTTSSPHQCNTDSTLDAFSADGIPQECQVTESSASRNDTTHWQYDGCLLDWALDLGYRLYPAFSTKTGIPYGTVNLLYGVPQGETTVASLAGGGTLTLEFELLSRLSGDVRFGQAAKRATRALFVQRSPDFDLFGKHIDVHTNAWRETLSGIGSNSDSFLEYLMKHYTVFPEDSDFWLMLVAAYSGVWRHSRAGDWYFDVGDMNRPNVPHNKRAIFESLMAFYPGLQVLLGELVPAARSLNAFFLVREWLGFLPERFSFAVWHVDSGGGSHPLRPELLESAYFLHRASRNFGSRSSHGSTNSTTTSPAHSGWQWAQDFAWRKLQLTRTECGYATVKRVSHGTSGHPHHQAGDSDDDEQETGDAKPTFASSSSKFQFTDEMPSFFLSETLKYLYLTFDDDNILHTDKDRQWIFTTEAHPIHHVPPVVPSKDASSPRAKQIKQLKQILRTKIKGKDTRLQLGMDLSREMWSDKLTSVSFKDDLAKIGNSVVARLQSVSRDDDINESSTFYPRQLETTLGSVHANNKLMVEPLLSNLANSQWTDRGIGEGLLLRKSCPNFASSDLLWQQALVGGSMDYVESFVTVGHDEDAGNENSGNENEADPTYTMYGAVEAIASLGDGLYLEQVDREQCPLIPSPVTDGASSKHSGSKSSPPPGSKHSEMTKFESPMGTFELSLFDGAGGFFVRHAESNEAINVVFVHSENSHDDHSSSFVMTAATMPTVYPDKPLETAASSLTSDTKMRLPAWQKVRLQTPSSSAEEDDDEEAEEDAEMEPEMERVVVMSDLDNNSFICNIGLVAVSAAVPEDEIEAEEEELYTIPCSPALFGPTFLPSVVHSGDLHVYAPLSLPTDNDRLGCPENGASEGTVATTPEFVASESPLHNGKEGEASCDSRAVQVLHRGSCTFFAKVKQRQQLGSASAVIIVNTEDELFVMSHSEEEAAGVNPDDIPLTVMISASDGQSIVDSVDELRGVDNSRHIAARISFSNQIVNAEKNNEFIFPVVQGAANGLDIYAKGGWGVQAKSPDGSVGTNMDSWQIHLIRHSLHGSVG